MDDAEPIIRNNFAKIPSVRGTRLTIYNIMDHHLEGESAEEIATFYGITVEEAEAGKRYIDQHIEELMPKYQRDLEWARRGNPPHIQALFAKSHQKLMRMKDELDRKKAREAGNARAAG